MGVSHDSGRTDACFLLLRERILSSQTGVIAGAYGYNASRLACCADFFTCFSILALCCILGLVLCGVLGLCSSANKQHTRDVLASGDVMVRGATPFALCIQNKLPPRATRRSWCFRALLCQKRPFYGV